MTKIIVSIVIGIAIFLFSIIYVDAWIVRGAFHAIGGSDTIQYAVLIKAILWGVVLFLTIGLDFFIALGVGSFTAIVFDSIETSRNNRKKLLRKKF